MVKMLITVYRPSSCSERQRRRREIVCLCLILATIMICLSSFTILNGDFTVDSLKGDVNDGDNGVISKQMYIGGNYRQNATSANNSHNSKEDVYYYNNNLSDDNNGDISNNNNNYLSDDADDGSADDDEIVVNAKLILFWTAWYKDPDWGKIFAKNGGPWVSYKDQDPITGSLQQRYCYLTTNRSLSSIADALIFHSTDFHRSYASQDVPARRYPWQNYVFFTLEPPQLNRLSDKAYRDAANAMQFNATMSYSRFSDVVFPYGRVFDFNAMTRSNPNFVENVRYRIANFVASFSKRPKDAVWIVSDCSTMGRRENIVRSLGLLGIKIDIWGKCWGNKQPDHAWRRFGMRTFFQQYRFYLAFENALCQEYISEKSFQGLLASAHYGLIPIVYGFGNYSQFLPQGSYIDSTTFPNARTLAGVIREISSPSYSPEKLATFYEWQYRHYVPTDLNNWRVVNGWRNLCRYLHAITPPPPQLKSSLIPEIGEWDAPSAVRWPPQSLGNFTKETSNQPKSDIRSKIGACVWTTDFQPEIESYDLQF